MIASKYNEDKKIVSFEINFFFALIGLPLMTFLSIYNGQMDMLTDALTGDNMQLKGLIIISGCSGILITISSILTVTLCGPIAQNIAGTIKDVGLTFIGFFFFDVKKATPAVQAGITMSFMGASYFTYMNYLARVANNKAAEA